MTVLYSTKIADHVIHHLTMTIQIDIRPGKTFILIHNKCSDLIL